MMWEEFENIAGYRVSYDTYKNIIEPMYMAIPENISKTEFCKMLNKAAFALPTQKELENKMKTIAKHLFEICGHSSDYDALHELEKTAKTYAKQFFGYDDNNIEWYCFIHKEYEYPELSRGCTYPQKLIIGYKNNNIKELTLIKAE